MLTLSLLALFSLTAFAPLSHASMSTSAVLICGSGSVVIGDWQLGHMSCFDPVDQVHYSAKLNQDTSSDALGGSLDGGVLYFPEGVPQGYMKLVANKTFHDIDDSQFVKVVKVAEEIQSRFQGQLPAWVLTIVKRVKLIPALVSVSSGDTQAYWGSMGLGGVMADELGDISIEFEGR